MEFKMTRTSIGLNDEQYLSHLSSASCKLETNHFNITWAIGVPFITDARCNLLD
jgi:hypothetical protein